MAFKTEEENRAFIEKMLPVFREHKRIIVDQYGEDRFNIFLAHKIDHIKRDLQIMIDSGTAQGIQVENIVNFHNQLVDERISETGGDIIDNLFNKQMNIIAGMKIRGYEI